MTMNPDEALTKLIENNIEVARKHDEILNGMTHAEARAWLKNLFKTYPVVWGIWRDAERGFDMAALKGHDLFKWSLEQTEGRGTIKMTAIQCTLEDGRTVKRAHEIADGDIRL